MDGPTQRKYWQQRTHTHTEADTLSEARNGAIVGGRVGDGWVREASIMASLPAAAAAAAGASSIT